MCIRDSSNPMHPSFSVDLARLCQILRELGFDPVLSPCLFDNGSGFSGTGAERADALMNLCCDPEITDVYKRQDQSVCLIQACKGILAVGQHEFAVSSRSVSYTHLGTCLYQEWYKPLLISCEAAIRL